MANSLAMRAAGDQKQEEFLKMTNLDEKIKLVKSLKPKSSSKQGMDDDEEDKADGDESEDADKLAKRRKMKN